MFAKIVNFFESCGFVDGEAVREAEAAIAYVMRDGDITWEDAIRCVLHDMEED